MKMILWILLILSPFSIVILLTWRVQEPVGEAVVLGHLYGPDQQPLGVRGVESSQKLLVIADRGPFYLRVSDKGLERIATTDAATWSSVSAGETVALWVDRSWLVDSDPRKLIAKRK